MTTKREFQSDAFEDHSAVSDMVRAGTIDKQTLRSFEVCRSGPSPFAKEIKARQ